MAWQSLSYAGGLARLGHDVFFFESSGTYESCYDPRTHITGRDPTYGLKFADAVWRKLGLEERWAYYDHWTAHWVGPAASRVREICSTADVVLNVSGVNEIEPQFEEVPRRVLIDTDPVFTQVRHLTKTNGLALVLAHTDFFTIGENLSALRRAADDGLLWRATREPIWLEQWPQQAGMPDGALTSVLHWDSYAPVEYNGCRFGMKSESFQEYISLPVRTGVRFELAMGGQHPSLGENGWTVIDPSIINADPWSYQGFVVRSKAEFAIAKSGYVLSQSGWFSERSASYLASGRPVVAQDTGFSTWLEMGRGVLAFNTIDEAMAGVQEINRDYQRHCRWAREIAHDYFDSDRVLSQLLDNVGESA